MSIQERLIALYACREAVEWAQGKTWEEIYTTCPRGDWLLWLFKKTNPDDLRLHTLAKARCANTIRHMMKDIRTLKAVDVAEQFGLGNSSLEELQAAVRAATDASLSAPDHAYIIDYAVASAADIDDECSVADYAATACGIDGEKANQQLTANVVRQTIAIEKYAI